MVPRQSKLAEAHRVGFRAIHVEPVGPQGAIGGVVDGKAGRDLQQRRSKPPIQSHEALVPRNGAHSMAYALVVLPLGLR